MEAEESGRIDLITFTRVFSDYHMKRGEPTYFVEQILNNLIRQNIECNVADIEAQLGFKLLPEFQSKCGSKGHTIRSGSDWSEGDRFSPAIWMDKPHVSKIVTIALDLEVKKTWLFECDEKGIIKIDGFLIDKKQKAEIAKNDGLSLVDFEEWLVVPCIKAKKPFKGQIICWDESISYELSKFERQLFK